MAALFKIVQDEHPALPDRISRVFSCVPIKAHRNQELRDFLMMCFRKDPCKRATAHQLLQHPWIQNARSKMVKNNHRITGDDDVVEYGATR